MSDSRAPKLNIALLGPPHIEHAAGPVDVSRRKAVALLVYLAVTGETQRRDTLATLLWPDSDQSRARAALRRDLSVLNKALGADFLTSDRETIGLNPDADIWLDVDAFQDKLAECENHGHSPASVCPECVSLLTDAVSLYRDDFLAGFSLRDCPEFDEWQFFQGESLRRELASALERLVQGHSARSEYEAAIAYARRWLALDPLHETAHQQLMRLYAWADQRAAALRQYEECERVLDEELGVRPSEETTQLYKAIKNRRAPPSPGPGAWLRALAARERWTPTPQPEHPTAQPPADWEPSAEPAEVENVFVGRDRELTRLGTFLDTVLAGRGQVVFVTGETGSGKTALTTEFARRAQDVHPDLIVAMGQCDAHAGVGDPYLPFREVLRMLTGDVEARLAQGAITQDHASRLRNFLRISGQALLDLGPDLIDIFVPAVGLATRAGTYMAGRMGWLDQLAEITMRQAQDMAAGTEAPGLEQSRIVEQFTNVLEALAKQQPLMLVVDDLHWADAASISLLFHLSRRIERSRILIVGTYRPEDVALGRVGPSAGAGQAQRHPLENVVNELKRYFGDVWLDLDETEGTERRQFVDALLDAEPNRLGREFRAALFRHTEGHPLFTVELMRDMQERGDLVQDEEGRWIEGPALDWGTLPARVEGVIDERIGRLADEHRAMLAVAAVEGEQFTAQVLARVQGLDERQVVMQLVDTLDRRHRLVSEKGAEALNGTRLYHYSFRHMLFQHYLYSGLSPIRRELLHADVGQALEELYQGRTDEVAVQLVRHFNLADAVEQVVAYAVQAGDRARRLGASREAINFYQLALQKALRLNDSKSVAERRRVHERLGDVYLENLSRHDAALEHYASYLTLTESEEDAARGDRKVADVYLLRGDLKGAQQNYEAALARLDSLPPLAEASRVHSKLSYLLISRNQLDPAAQHARACLEISQQIGDVRGLADGHRVMGIIANGWGDLELACEHDERSLELYRDLGDLSRLAQACNNVGDTYRQLGQMDRALDHLHEGIEVARRIGDVRDEALLLITTAELLLDQGRWETAIAHLKQALPLAEESGMAARIIMVHWTLGSAYTDEDQLELARRHLEIAEALTEDTQHLRYVPRICLELGRLSAAQDSFDKAWEYLRLAVDHAGPEPSDGFLGLLHRYYGYAHGRRKSWDDAVVHLEQSLEFLEHANLPAEVGKTCLDLGTAYASRGNEGDWGRACDRMVAAQSIFRRIEARGYLAQVEARLKEVGCRS